MTRNECAAFLRTHDDYLILTHRRPDGDALGCCAALCLGLKKLGKAAYVLPNPEAARHAGLLLGTEPPAGFVPGAVVSVDLAEEGILQINADEWKGKIQLAIDHHPSNSGYARESLVDTEAGACGEIIYELLSDLGAVDREIATLLYIAVTTDTGCFRYKNTTPRTLRIGADLMEAGAPVDLNRTLFMKKSRSRLALEGTIISGLEFFQGGEAAVAALSIADVARCGATDSDMDDIASIAGSVEGVELSITMRETKKDEWKISVRTGQYGNAGVICAEFGGGGHGMAAGCTVPGTLTEAREKIKAAVAAHWHELPL